MVRNDHVTRTQHRDQTLQRPGGEGGPVHRGRQSHRRNDPIGRQRSDESGGLPVAVRDCGAAALFATGSAVSPCHFGTGGGRVDEKRPGRLLRVLPSNRLCHAALTSLRSCSAMWRDFFTRDAVTNEAFMNHRQRRAVNVRLTRTFRDLGACQVRPIFDKCQA